MVNVKVTMNNSSITGLEVKGHAESAEYGKDLVCAGVSSVTTGLLNALDTLCPDTCELQLSPGYVSVKVNQITEENQLILKVGKIQLETIELSNKKFIRIKKVEV